MSQKQHYEITFIINANLPENEHLGIVDFVKNLITKNSGEMTLEENLERKKLTYPIKKVNKGVFYSIRFNIEAESLKTIEKEISLNHNILRYLTIKKSAKLGGLDITKNLEEKINDETTMEKPKANIIKNVKPREKAEKKSEIKEEVKEEIKIENKLSEEPKIKENEKTEEKVEIKEEKVEQNELDKKLDEILNEEI